MHYLRLVIYVLVSTVSMLSAQLSSSSDHQLAQATVVSAQLKTILSGFSLYVINNWNNLVLATPGAITYKLPTGASRNVAHVLAPTASELMLLGFLPTLSSTATSYPLPTIGGGYQTALSFLPTGCQGNACTVELYACMTSPLGSNKFFDIHYFDSQSMGGNISIGYSMPGTPGVINGPNNTWSYSLAGNTNAGIAMIHTFLGINDFSTTYPCVLVACWKSPSNLATAFPNRLNTVGDVRLEERTGNMYFWTVANWRNLDTNSTFTSYLGPQAGNTGSNNTNLGNSSGQALYVSP